MSDMRGVSEVDGISEFKYSSMASGAPPKARKLFDEYRPYDRSVFARVASSDRPEASPAVDAAAKAFPPWSQSILAVRTRLSFKAGGEPQ